MSLIAHRISLIAMMCILAGFSAASAATVHIRAVRLNGEPITPTHELKAQWPDIVEVEITVSGWGTSIDTVKTYQVMVDNDKLYAVGFGRPLHFDDPELRPTGAFININSLGRGICSEESNNAGASCVSAPVACDGGTCVDGMCLGGVNAGQLCATPDNQCQGGTCVDHPDFIFSGFANPICAASTFAENYPIGCTLFLDDGPADPSRCVGGGAAGSPCDGDADCPDGTCDVTEFYLATVVLVAGGTCAQWATFDLVPAPASWLSDPNRVDVEVATVPLRLRSNLCIDPFGACCFGPADCWDGLSEADCAAGGGVYGGDMTTCAEGPDSFCACPTIVDASPPNCAIDARYPYAPGGSPARDRIGFESVEVTLSPGTEMSLLTTDSFYISHVGGGNFNPPVISAVTPLGGTTVRVEPEFPFMYQRWTCLQLACAGYSEKTVCWGHLPGDVDGGGQTNAADILALIDFLDGTSPERLAWYQCDIDDSGACNAADVLAVIDLLNGAGNFDPWNRVGTAGGACPTEP